MIYIKENGVTVKDDGLRPDVEFHRFQDQGDEAGSVDYLSPTEAETLLRGLLRWKLENEGVDACKHWFADTMTDALLGPDPEKSR